jgi:hypothetical protein
MTAGCRIALTALLLMVALQGGAAGKTYRWVDDQGKVHYGDQPPPNAAEITPGKPPAAKTESASVNADAPAQHVSGALGPEECQRRRDLLASYRNAAAITETDALGKRRDYSEDERRQRIATTEQGLRDGCPN